MSYTARHAARVSADGMLTLLDPLAWRAACARHHGHEVWITVKRVQNFRTLAANRYYWGVVVEEVAAYIGEDREETHQLLKMKHLPARSIETLEGVVLDDVPPTTRNLTTEEFAAYIERVKVWAAQFLGLHIPEAGQVEAVI